MNSRYDMRIRSHMHERIVIVSHTVLVVLGRTGQVICPLRFFVCMHSTEYIIESMADSFRVKCFHSILRPHACIQLYYEPYTVYLQHGEVFNRG